MKYLIDSPHLSQYCPVHKKISNASQRASDLYIAGYGICIYTARSSYHALHLNNILFDGGDKGKVHRDVHEQSSTDDHIVQ